MEILGKLIFTFFAIAPLAIHFAFIIDPWRPSYRAAIVVYSVLSIGAVYMMWAGEV